MIYSDINIGDYTTIGKITDKTGEFPYKYEINGEWYQWVLLDNFKCGFAKLHEFGNIEYISIYTFIRMCKNKNLSLLQTIEIFKEHFKHEFNKEVKELVYFIYKSLK